MVPTMRVTFECTVLPRTSKLTLNTSTLSSLLFVGGSLAAGKIFRIVRLDIELSRTRQKKAKINSQYPSKLRQIGTHRMFKHQPMA